MPRLLRRRAVPAGALGLALATVVLGAGCAKLEQHNGYVLDDYTVNQIRPGVTDRDSVATLLGTPTTSAAFRDDTWYYISRRSEQFAFFNEDVTDQQVLAVRFSDAGIVDEVKRYSMEDGRIIDPVARATPTRGREMTVLEQLFGNLGRFNNPNAQANPATRRPGGL